MMRLLETIYLGDDTREMAIPSKAHVIRFCASTVYAHGTLISQICPAFVKAQLMCDEGISDKPYHVAVIFPFSLDKVRKPEDVETCYDRIKWYFRNLRKPDCGMVVSFYQNLESKDWITEPWHLNQMWPLAERWEPKGDYITLQKMEPLAGGSAKRVKHLTSEYEDKCVALAEKMGLEVKVVDYLTPFDELLTTMKYSDHHFTYRGATYFFAGLLGLPTTSWCAEEKRSYQHLSYYTYSVKERVWDAVQKTRWGTLATNWARIMQWDDVLNVVTNKPIDYIHNIDSLGEIENEFRRLSMASSRNR